MTTNGEPSPPEDKVPSECSADNIENNGRRSDRAAQPSKLRLVISKYSPVMSIVSVIFTGLMAYFGWVNTFSQKLSDEEIRVLITREVDDFADFLGGFYDVVDDSMEAVRIEVGRRGFGESTILHKSLDKVVTWACDSIDSASRDTYRRIQDVLRIARVSDTTISELEFLARQSARWDSLSTNRKALESQVQQRAKEY